ncbi:MAG: hypothetical protein QW343_00310, partial [Candidatus Norongarragalinales archaeon]
MPLEESRNNDENKGTASEENAKPAPRFASPRIVSRGIPAGEALWLPRHDEVRAILRKQSNAFDEYGVEWSVEDVLSFLFPPRYRPEQYKIAVAFVKMLCENAGAADFHAIGDFVARSGASKATFYNKIVPRLKHAGLIEVKRPLRTGARANEKGPLSVQLSETFHNYLFRLAKEWRRIVLTARSKRE